MITSALTRGIALFLLGWFGLLLVATLQAAIPLSWGARFFAAPDLPLLVVLFLGLQRPSLTPQATDISAAGACALAVGLGYLADLFAGAPKGLHEVAYAIAMIVARGASARLLVRGFLPTALVTLFFATVTGLVTAALRASFESPEALVDLGVATLRELPKVAIATALVAPLWLRLLRRVDRRFVREPSQLGALA